MAIELNFEGNSPINGHFRLDGVILEPALYEKLRTLSIANAQSPEGMARLLIEQSLK